MSALLKLDTPPTVTDPLTGNVYPLQGTVKVGDKYYDVSDAIEIPTDLSKVVSTGKDRYKNIPQADHDAILVSEILNQAKPTENKFLKIKDVQPVDIVKKTNLVPHRWFGE